MPEEHGQEYDDDMVTLLEAVWGDGFLSPGGPDEIRKIVEDVDFAGKRVLDIGCGTGGIGLFLTEQYAPASFTGIDVETGLIVRANVDAEQRGLHDKVNFLCVEPGPLPLDAGAFDVVFSKDAMVHIADKESLFQEIFRVLSPGGIVAAGDWMSSTEGPFSEDLKAYIALEDLGFGMASPDRYEGAMKAAGFQDVRMTDRNPWYKEQVAHEYDALSGSLYKELVNKVGQEFVDHSVDVWRALKVVVDSGEMRPTHMRAHKPA
ncbi:MAG: methyltransferase domain-containing protein [Rhodobacteraceae bacterium]|nr:methyltransferase domain-containing protein [Paracoccaceae bacterium]